jgi:hypothetical protein
MSALATTRAVSGPLLAAETLRGFVLWVLAFSGAFVFIEPSPYEVVGVVAILIFALTGLSLTPPLTPLVLLLMLLNVGYALSVVQVSDQPKLVIWVLVSAFLAVTAVFYAAVLGANTNRRLELLMRGYVAAAVVASIVAVAAYFRLLGGASDVFLLYGRARGTFNDPNVLGAFLVLPGLVVFQRMLAGRAIVGNGLLLLLMLAALFLSFSRGAWGIFALSTMVLMALTFITTPSAGERVRIVLVAILGVMAIAGAVAALLSIDRVADLFAQRATLDQSYDVGRYGRFGRYLLGAELALDHPLGIGPLQFYRFFTEDPHNTFLNAFMSGGWLGGFAYLTLSAVTVVMSTRLMFVRTPWQPVYHAVYAAYLGVVVESVIIDIDHWRHYFLILGVLWGLMAATRDYAVVTTARPAPARYPG